MFGDLKNKLNQGKEELHERLKTAYVRQISNSGSVEVIASGNKEIIDIKLSGEALEDIEYLQDELIVTLNRAIQAAEELHNSEMKSVMSAHMPNIPGLDGLLD